MPTREHDQWVRSAFGIDPSEFDRANSGAGKPSPQRAQHDTLLAKARQVWLATRKKVEGDITALQGQISQAYKGHDMAKQLEDAFMKRVEPVLGSLDDRLAHKLDAITKGEDGQRQKLVSEARDIIVSYERFLDGDDVIDHLDRNPVMPLSIRKTLDTALDSLGKALG